MKRLLIIPFVLCTLVNAPGTLAAISPPKGAIKLQSVQVRNFKGTKCAYLKSKWTPGTVHRKTWFVSHLQQAANFAAEARRANPKERTGLLKQASSWKSKAAKFQPLCDTFNVSPTSSNPSATTPSTAPPQGANTLAPIASAPSTTQPVAVLKFNLSNAVGLTLTGQVSASSVRKAASGSNLRAVSAGGTLSDAVSSGSANISRFLIAPNDKLYVLFSEPTKVGDTSTCLLAEVGRQNGLPTCIESELRSIVWPSSTTGYEPIQFGSNGEIYYLGYGGSAPNDFHALRRYANGVATSLINDNVMLRGFTVLKTNDVLLEGSTKSTGAKWLRRVASSGALSTVATPFESMLSVLLPDGSVLLHSYYSVGVGNYWGYRRFLATEGRMEDNFWVITQIGSEPASRFNLVDVCPVTPVKNNAFCTSAGQTKKVIRTTNGSVLLLQEYNGFKGSLTRVFPTLGEYSTSVANITVAQQVVDNLILSGTNAAGQNVTTLLDINTGNERELIPSSNEIEVYRLNYSVAQNKVMFDGLRFSDNKYVIGQIDLGTGEISASQTGSTKLLDFQTFAS